MTEVEALILGVWGFFLVFLFVCLFIELYCLSTGGNCNKLVELLDFQSLISLYLGYKPDYLFDFLFHLNGQARETFSVGQRERLLLQFAN